MLAILVAFPLAAGATEPASASPAAVETASHAQALVLAHAPAAAQAPVLPLVSVLIQAPVVVQVPLIAQPPARQPTVPLIYGVPSLVAPASEKLADRVISPVEVDLQVNTGLVDEPEEGDRDGFFDTASEEVGKGKDGDFAGMTNPIDKFIDYFTNRGRKRMELYLARSGKYREMMRGILAKYGLPEDLIYLALIE
ncbi:MAG: hypothetical protein IH611_06035, partial [Deltaproteobacteria bacterium]|nr:hypothetical protein [Deltaproteobacteria bacterium]